MQFQGQLFRMLVNQYGVSGCYWNCEMKKENIILIIFKIYIFIYYETEKIQSIFQKSNF